MRTIKDEKKRIRRLDWIRVISCIMEFLYHLNILKGGYLAVCTFFVLSGYLSCSSALNNSNFSIKKYYKKRIIKLYIPLVFVVAITVITSKIMKNIIWMNLKQETISAFLGYNNFWQLKANLDYFTRHTNSPFMHLWYISILIQFDLAFPFFYFFFKKVDEKYKKNVSVIVAFLISILLTIIFLWMSIRKSIMFVYYNTFTRLFSIVYGVLLALILHKYDVKIPKKLMKNNKIIFRIYALILIIMGICVSNKANNYAIYMIIVSLISVRLIRYANFEKAKRRSNFIDRVISAIAKFSYEIYLIQYPIIFFMQNIINNEILKAVIIVIFTFIISYLIHMVLNKKLANRAFNVVKKCSIRINNNYKLFYSDSRKRL